MHLKRRTGCLLDSVSTAQCLATVIKKKRGWNNKKILSDSICTICLVDLSFLFLGFYLFLDVLLLANLPSSFP